MTSLAAFASSIAAAVGYPSALYAVLAALGVLCVATLLAWLILHTVFIAQQTAFEPYDALLLAQTSVLGNNVVALAVLLTQGIVDTFFALADTAKSTFSTFAPVFILAIVGIAYLETQPFLAEAYLWARQCTVMPYLEGLAFPLLNLARLLYAVAWPFVNIGAELAQFFWRGQFKILFACTSGTDLRDIADELGTAAKEFAIALGTWLANVFTLRIDMLPTLLHIGNTANLLMQPLSCFCAFLDPLWAMLAAIPQDPSVHTSIDCAVNIPVRFSQALFNFFAFGLPPLDMGPTVVEINCAVVGLGDAAQDILLLVSEAFFDLLNQLLMLSTPAAGSSNRSLSLVANRFVAVTPSNVVHSLLHTSAAPVQSADFWVGVPAPDFLNSTLGFESLLLLLTSQWSHIVTEPVAAVVTVVNMTIAVAMHTTCPDTCDCLIDSPLGLRFLQLGPVANRLRAAVDAASTVLAVVTWPELPPVVSRLGQAGVTMVEAVLEFVFGWAYAIFFPTWRPGDGALTDTHCNACDPTPCPFSPADTSVGNWPTQYGTWSIFSYWPLYYDWPGNALNRSRQLLLDDADALAVAFGCNLTTTTGDPNVDDCAAYPGQCFLRRLYQLVIELLRLAEQFVLYVPDLVFFDVDQGNHTFAKLDPTLLVTRFNQTLDCLTSWLDELDGSDHCLTNDVPYGGFDPDQHANQTLPPPEDYVESMPGNWTLFCHNDSLFYYPDGRLFLLRPSAPDANVSAVQCDPLATNNGCYASYGSRNGTTYYLKITGSPPSNQVFIDVSLMPTLIPPHLVVFHTNVTQPPLFGNYFGQYPDPGSWDTFGIVDAYYENCTEPGYPLQDPLPVGLMCGVDSGTGRRRLEYRPPETTTGMQPQAGLVDRCEILLPDTFPALDSLGSVTTNCHFGVPPNEADCDIELPPQIKSFSCPSALKAMAMAQYGKHNLEAYFVELRRRDTPNCFDAVSDPIPAAAVCRYSQLNRDNIDDTIYSNYSYPFYLKPFPKSRIPCRSVMPIGVIANFTCDSYGSLVESGPGYKIYWTYQHNKNASSHRLVPCQQNLATVLHPAAPAGPKCGRVRITYKNPDILTNATNPFLYLTIQVDGTNVRVRFNETAGTDIYNWTYDQALTCVQPFTADAAAVTAESAARFWASYEAGQLAGAGTAYGSILQHQRQDPSASLFQPNGTFAFRKQTLICTLSAAIECAGEVIVSLGSELMLTAQSLLMLITAHKPIDFPPLRIPSFEEARDKLRCALCQLATAVTLLVPVTYDCPDLQSDAGCGNGQTCAQGFLCAVVDVFMLALDVLVEVLRTARQIVDDTDNHNPQSDLTAGACRSIDDAPSCIINMIIYVVKKTIHALMQVARAAAANVNCLICAVITAASGDCSPFLYDFVDALATLVDGLANTVLTYLVKMLLSLVSFVVHLFTGRFTEAFSELGDFFVAFVDLIVSVGQSIVTTIWSLLESIPIIGDVFRFLRTVFDFACGILQSVLNAFSGDAPDLDCGTKKRSTEADFGSWMPTVTPALVSVWHTYAPACEARVAAFINTSHFDYQNPDEAELDEFLFCMSASLWIGPEADATRATILVATAQACDMVMPALYASGVAWPDLSLERRALAKGCMMPRLLAESARRGTTTGAGAAWVPHDLFYNPLVRLPLLVDDLYYGYTVYGQYYSDRSLPAEMVVADPKYAANWALDGFDTTHLDAVGAAATVGALLNLSLIDAWFAEDNRVLGLALDQYAARAVLTTQGAMSWRRRDPATVNGTAHFWRGLFGDGKEDSGSNTSTLAQMPNIPGVVANITEKVMRRLAARHVLDPPMRQALTLSALSAAPAAALAKAARGTTRYVFTDGVTILARFYTNATDMGLGAKFTRALGQLGQAAVTATQMVRDLVSGAAQRDAAAAPDAPRESTIRWSTDPNKTLSAVGRAIMGSFSGAWAAGPGQVSTLVGALMQRSPTAQLRRSRVASLSTRLQDIANLGVSAVGGVYQRDASARTRQAVWGSVDAAECLTTYTDLCTSCLWLDNWIGTIVKAFSLAFSFWSGPASQEPSLNFTMQQYTDYQTYLGDPLATVIVGDSAELPVRWPSPVFNNLRWFGDPTPNKLRFSDLGPLWDSLYDSLAGSFDNTVDLSAAAVANRSRRGIGVLGHAALVDDSMDGAVARVALGVLSSFGVQGGNASSAPMPVSVDATGLDANASLLGWATYIYTSVRVCDYQEEIDGTLKRFSIGEALLIVGVAGFGVGLIVAAPMLGNLLAALVVALGVSGVTVALFTLFFAYTFSMRCLPAAPLQAADDIMYFIVYELAARCDWFWASGYLNEDTYTNDNCYACSLYLERTFTAASCKYDVGFGDFGYYVSFWLQRYWPAAIEWIQTTTIPIISDMRNYAVVKDRLNAFGPASYDAADPVAFSQHTRCGNGETAVASLFIALAWLLLISLLRPLVDFFLRAANGVVFLAWSVATVAGTAFHALLVVPALIARDMAATAAASAAGGEQAPDPGLFARFSQWLGRGIWLGAGADERPRRQGRRRRTVRLGGANETEMQPMLLPV
jgi:hypothetical protein